ncbi:MAG TPA: zinc-ribbon domain-containing protein [Roseiflexaceae bacterium]|nr:zinc-ribbon domain-containing protein [Roseiflexaceae bacterium]
MKCPNCGAENDAANRFCEQCGAQLPTAAPGAQAAMADAPTISAATACPNCGAQVLPGEAFCDECGAALPAAAVATTAQASTPASGGYQDVSLPSGSQQRADGAAVNLVCPVCGHQNLPGDQFCDNCGAALTGTAPATTPQQSGSNSSASALFDSEAPTMVDTALPPLPQSEPAATIPDMPPAKPSEPVEEPPTEPAPPRNEPPAPNVPEQEPASNPPLDAPPAQEPEPMTMSAPASSSDTLLNELLNPATASAPTTMDMATYEAERKRLEDEISRQQQVIAQLEPVQNALGAATPAGVTNSLQQARDALQQAQHAYDTLQPPAPAIDPAEVARLEDEISRQQQVIAQLEPVQNALGAATPAGVAESIQQARDALQQAQTALAALQGGAAAPATTAPEPTNAPEPRSLLEEVAAPAREAAMAASQQAPAQPESAPAPEAAPAAPRFVLEDGKEIALPPNKQEIIIGREDPISGVYPEIDLTPYGGESGGVSRQHARMNHADGQWTITDLNSTNYTRVDGNKIEPNTPVPVQDGSRVQLGRVAMTFHAQ